MMPERPNRRLSNRFVYFFLSATEAVLGSYSLRLGLMNAGLQRYEAALPPCDDGADVLASEYAAFHDYMRVYFGRGARGSLGRIGQETWQRILADAPLAVKTRLTLARILPRPARSRRTLEILAAVMRQPDANITVHLLDMDLIFVDQSSDITFGKTTSEPICWATMGMIQAALSWANGSESDVEEIACRALGAESCRFRIKL